MDYGSFLMLLGLSFDRFLIRVGDYLGESSADHWVIWVGPMASDLGIGLPTRALGLPWAGPLAPTGLDDV